MLCLWMTNNVTNFSAAVNACRGFAWSSWLELHYSRVLLSLSPSVTWSHGWRISCTFRTSSWVWHSSNIYLRLVLFDSLFCMQDAWGSVMLDFLNEKIYYRGLRSLILVCNRHKTITCIHSSSYKKFNTLVISYVKYTWDRRQVKLLWILFLS